LEVFHSVGGIQKCRAKSLRLTSYLELLLLKFILTPYSITILTPPFSSQRGAQLSLLLPANLQLKPILRALEKNGAICDGREPNVVRVSPAPLYNTFSDVFALIHILATVLKSYQS
jgi:kynureninase